MNRRWDRSIALAGVLLSLIPCAVWAGESTIRTFAPDQMETVLYGVAYYPEYVPAERLDKDVELMRKAGINVVRVGESTWSSWEPRDGEFQFDWMERALNRLHQAGIKVILGTPTYSIPTWLYRKYPDILVTHNGTAPPLATPYFPTYPPAVPQGFYGPRQNHDILNPNFRRYAERIIRKVVGRFHDHPAVIGFQIDNETSAPGAATPHTMAGFLQRLKRKYEVPETINRIWGLAYWGQLVSAWEDLPGPSGILNPGYKLEWENFQHDTVTEYLAWQAEIVREYKRPEQFIMQDFSSGAHSNLDQWAIAEHLDVAAENPYYETQRQFNGRAIWFSGDVGRSLKKTNYLVTETNAQSIGWDSRTQFPPYPGQLRQAAYAHLAAGANMVSYWHWSSLHSGQETYWKGILSHDLEPGRVYQEMTRVAGELKRLGPQLVNLKKDNKIAILFSADSANALSYMPFGDHTDYQTILQQMWDALYDLNVEADIVQPGDNALSRYKVVLVPPLYSASDAVLDQLSEYVKAGGHVVMAFKSGFTDQYSTVRSSIAPGPLRAAAGFRYQEFTNLGAPVRLKPDPFHAGAENRGSVWAELLIPESAEVLASLDDSDWHTPVITRNRYGNGTLTYEATVVTSTLQREIVRDALTRAGLSSADQQLPATVRVRHGSHPQGNRLHYYFNFSGAASSFAYPYGTGIELFTGAAVTRKATIELGPWDLAIVLEN